jgi:hypothetical protein
LALTTRELAWVAPLRVLGQPHAREHYVNSLTSCCPICLSESFKRLGEYAPDRPNRVQGTIRVLKDDLRLAVKRTPLLERQVNDISSSEANFAGLDGDEPKYRVRQRRFSRARLTDEPDRLARANIEANVIDGVHGASALAVADTQLTDLKQRSLAHAGSTSATISSKRMQRVARSVWDARRGISWALHFAAACGHRGAKRQPFGQLPGDGTLPGIVFR